jgi:2-amino-4-hydroxy-6-hydroxymethyldihydropteridine diphosphokinase
MRAVIALGSNLGDRASNIREAIDHLSRYFTVEKIATSITTEPVGYTDQPDFLNTVLIADSPYSALETLKILLSIENHMGRERNIHWGPRNIDLDLITYGQEILQTDELTLPHPRAHEREFVLAPWCEIDPDAVIPGRGRISDLLS